MRCASSSATSIRHPNSSRRFTGAATRSARRSESASFSSRQGQPSSLSKQNESEYAGVTHWSAPVQSAGPSQFLLAQRLQLFATFRFTIKQPPDLQSLSSSQISPASRLPPQLAT